MPPWIDRVDARIDALPAWARPPFYGMAFVYFLVAQRVVFALPIAVIVLFKSGGDGLLTAIELFLLAGVAGFASGAIYSLVRQPLRRFGNFGGVVTGWLCVLAYLCVIAPALSPHHALGRSDLDLRDRGTWLVLGVMAVFFGSIIGIMLFGDSAPSQRRRSQANRRQRRTSEVLPPAT